MSCQIISRLIENVIILQPSSTVELKFIHAKNMQNLNYYEIYTVIPSSKNTKFKKIKNTDF